VKEGGDVVTVKRDLIIAVLATFCLAATLFMILPTQSAPAEGEYDPWLDVNDDGEIDILDLSRLALAFKSSGEPIDKTSLLLELQTARAHNETHSTTLETISGYPAIFDWQDMADMAVEITLETEGTILITLSVQAIVTGAGQEMYVRAMVDATPANPATGITLTKSLGWASYSYTFYITNIGAGTHEIKMQWKLYDETGNGQVLGRTLIVTALLP
jgi:hypothetical protein